jgi:hypothetical protein
MPEDICRHCGDPIPLGSRRVFCSDACYNGWNNCMESGVTEGGLELMAFLEEHKDTVEVKQ